MSRGLLFSAALLAGTVLATTLGLAPSAPALAAPAAAEAPPSAILPVQYRDWAPRDAWGRPLPPPPPRDWRWRRDHYWREGPPPRAYYAPPPPPPHYGYGYGRPAWGY